MDLLRVAWVRAAARVALIASVLGCGAGAPPNILLVTLDTTRADHLGAYGHHRDTSPAFDALAAEGVLYRNARSTSSWTLPSHASIFTGKFPTSHGARYDSLGPMKLGTGGTNIQGGPRARGLSPEEETLAHRLTAAGYATAGFAGGPWLLRAFGLAAGFEHWDDEGIKTAGGRRGGDLVDAALAWLEAWRQEDAGRPFFAFVNLFDAHFPFDAPAPYTDRFLPPGVTMNKLDRRQFEALYDAEIRYADDQLARLLDFLRDAGVYDDTLVIVTADHGEMLGEHGEWGHNGLLFEPLVRIPLVVKWPGPPRPRTDDTPVQLRHLFGWILGAAGAAGGEAGDGEAPSLAEVWHGPEPGIGEWKALWLGPLKYMHHDRGEHRLFDLERDPRERVNLLESRPEDARRLEEALSRRLAALPEPLPPGEPTVISPETREALERLGYLGAETGP